jgi:hypothetical protein
MRKFYYVKRLGKNWDGSIVEIPETSLAQTLRTHKEWEVVESTEERITGVPTAEAPKTPAHVCPICGMESTEHGLKVHKARKH